MGSNCTKAGDPHRRPGFLIPLSQPNCTSVYSTDSYRTPQTKTPQLLLLRLCHGCLKKSSKLVRVQGIKRIRLHSVKRLTWLGTFTEAHVLSEISLAALWQFSLRKDYIWGLFIPPQTIHFHIWNAVKIKGNSVWYIIHLLLDRIGSI